MLARPAVHVAALAALALVFCLGRVALTPLEGDPAMYATIAKTVARTGEWLHLTFNGDPYLNKPPLHFWLNALVFRVLPPTALSASLAPGLLGVAGTLLVYALCRVMFAGWETAFFAALVYVLTPEVVHWSAGVHLETLVTFWVLLGLLAVYRSVAEPWAVVLLGVATIGGWLSKGPQGLFPACVAPLVWAREGVFLRRVRSGPALIAAALAVVTIGPWLAARLAEGSGFAHTYFGEQIADVLMRGGERVRGPFWYIGKLARTYWPWLPVAVVGIVLLARRWSTSLAARLWLTYGAVVLGILSLAAGKKSRYLFQLYPALAVAAGVALAAASERVRRLPALLLAPALAGAVIALGVVAWRGAGDPGAYDRDAREVAALLPEDRPVWLTRRTQYGRSRLGKVLGFYARPLLATCRGPCDDEIRPGAVVVARATEADALAAALGGRVTARHGSLALVER